MGSYEWTFSSDHIKCSSEVYAIFGINPDNFGTCSKAFLNCVHPDDLENVELAIQSAIQQYQSYDIDHRIKLPDGTIKTIHGLGEVEFDDQNQPLAMTGTLQDVTQVRLAEAKLKLFATVFENASEGMVITDSDNRIVILNEAYSKATGYSKEELIGRNPNVSNSGEHTPEFYTQMWDSIMQTGKWQGEIIDRRKDGQLYPKWLHIDALRDNQGSITHYIGSFTDITELKAKEKHLLKLAYSDKLTRLANRSYFDQRLTQELALAKRNQNKMALLYIDLDFFKQVNDQYGHAVGDELLREVSNRMKKCVRESDTLARLGGMNLRRSCRLSSHLKVLPRLRVK
ncbi:MAG: diguanylate cyclase [Gammaproteobacteria bacterium]|nr:diguanylate cyclase [Gammaproteobacteria bacterium]